VNFDYGVGDGLGGGLVGAGLAGAGLAGAGLAGDGLVGDGLAGDGVVGFVTGAGPVGGFVEPGSSAFGGGSAFVGTWTGFASSGTSSDGSTD
jgi:hypothetical protein